MTSANYPGGRRLGGKVWIEKKPRCCPICTHPWILRIEAAILSGRRDADVETEFQFEPGTVARHCQECIPKKGFAAETARRLQAEASRVMAELTRLHAELLAIDPAAKSGSRANNIYCQMLETAQKF